MDDHSIPAAVAARLDAGLPLVTAWRHFCGVSIADLAVAVAERPARLIELELGLCTPEPALLERIAVALGLEPGALRTSG